MCKKMKQLALKILFITLFILNMAACENFLAEDPRSLISPDQYFNSDQEVEAAINGIYGIYKSNPVKGSSGIDRWYEYGADTIGANRVVGRFRHIMAYTISEENIDETDGRGGGPRTWQGLYEIILNTNIILERIDGNEKLSEAGRNQFRGEALFLRAYAYYHLTNLWGDVPYYRDELGIEEIRNLGRSDVNQIRNDILNDLQEAQNLLPDSYSESNLGKASKWAAATLIVKIALWLEDWQLARDKAVEIINNSPHRLLDDFGDVFDPLNEYNDELIWELDHVKDLDTNTDTDVFNPRIRDEPANSEDREALINELDERGWGMTGFGQGVALPDLINKFPEDDLRRGYTVRDTLFGIQLSFPYLPKLWNLDIIDSPRGNHGENKIIFRLADVYLMAAEAENELNGPTSDAYQYINEVRKRAYDPEQPLAGLTQQEFREAIYDERKWELAGENQRRMDLIRWGILMDVVSNTEYRIFDPASNIQPQHVLLPLPVEELRLNPALLDSDPTNNGYR